MTTLELKTKDSSQGTHQSQEDKTRDDIRAVHQIIFEYLRLMTGEQEDTSPEEKKEKPYTWRPVGEVLQYGVLCNEAVILANAIGTSESIGVDITDLEQALEEGKGEVKADELKRLDDYVVDDFSIEYHSSKKLYEHVKSLRRQHELED